MMTSILIVTLNNLTQTQRCLESIRLFTDAPYELILIDNGSEDGTVAWLSEQPDVRLISNGTNRGFAEACNQGAAAAKGDNILLLNNDTIVSHRWLSQLLSALYADGRTGMVGPMSNFVLPFQLLTVTFPNEESYHRFTDSFNRRDPILWKNVTSLSGFCLLLRRKTWNRLSGLDERYGIGSYEDIDLGYRALKAGLTLRVAGDTFVFHEGNSSFQQNGMDIYGIAGANRRLFLRKWRFNPERLILTVDPAFFPGRYSEAHPHHEPKGPTLPSGWFASDENGGVYRIERGYKRPVVSFEAFCRLNMSMDRVASDVGHLLDKLPTGNPLQPENRFPDGYPDVFLARDPVGDTFAVTNGIRYPFNDAGAYAALGLRQEEAVEVSDTEIILLPAGWPLRQNVWEEHELFDYLLYRGPDGTFYYGEGQRLRRIAGEDAFARYGWRRERALAIPEEVFERTPKGYDIV
ncbi:glycosyltransferase family 2 protein [Cohnella luojiensis]|uniref:Glycosyltransferase family 2 protein n=1 Tax=Cohnella luojiensis TaxID=652876 RepID=A0A4Y8LZD3_9BACL|nr:glycosyltransferase family 2 protein [Cohnella luojiensis]TFE27844.1 glycosyltransferase family 2 protein [Cohnella luojiensis]